MRSRSACATGRLCALSLAAAMALGGSTAAAAPPAAAPPAGGAQARYDAAQAAFDKGDWAAAVAGFGGLVPSGPDAHLARSQALISSRLGYALLQLGRNEEARVIAARAAGALSEADRADLADALVTSADADRFVHRYARAADAYRRAVALEQTPHDPGRLMVSRSGLALSLMTQDPQAAAAVADEMLADKPMMAMLDPALTAVVYDLRARAAMNAHDAKTAATWIERSIAKSGGLNDGTVTSAQVRARTDAALIYALQHDDENVRKYIAYTGAGHLEHSDWVGSFNGDLPVCGEDGVRPEDFAIVEFAIGDTGDVRGAAPLYASRPGPIGADFARTVSTWWWDADALKGVRPFWRNNLVLQLSCQTRPTPEKLGLPFSRGLVAWLESRGVRTSVEEIDRPAPASDPRLQSQGVDAIPVLLSRIPRADPREDLGARLERVLDANHAPADAYALLAEAEARAKAFRSSARGRPRARALDAALAPLAARFPSTPALAWLELEAALAWEDGRDFQNAAPLLKAVLATPEASLPADAPIRRVALLHAGIVARHTSDKSLGRNLADSGLNADQCSLFDTHPVASSMAVSYTAFPQEAQRWGFEGYVRESYDIADDGKVADVRTLVAYPPLIFGKSTEQVVRGFRYEPPKIGSQAVGCTGQTTSVRYQLGY